MNNAETKARLQMLSQGDMGLQETFWVYFLSVTVVLGFLGAFLGAFGMMFSLAAVGWTLFMVMPVFKAAAQYQGVKVWALLARLAMIVFALMAVISILLNVFAMLGGVAETTPSPKQEINGAIERGMDGMNSGFGQGAVPPDQSNRERRDVQ